MPSTVPLTVKLCGLKSSQELLAYQKRFVCLKGGTATSASVADCRAAALLARPTADFGMWHTDFEGHPVYFRRQAAAEHTTWAILDAAAKAKAAAAKEAAAKEAGAEEAGAEEAAAEEAGGEAVTTPHKPPRRPKRPLEAAEEGTWPPSLRAAFARVAGLVPSKPLAVSEGGGTRWQEMFGRCLVAESHELHDSRDSILWEASRAEAQAARAVAAVERRALEALGITGAVLLYVRGEPRGSAMPPATDGIYGRHAQQTHATPLRPETTPGTCTTRPTRCTTRLLHT